MFYSIFFRDLITILVKLVPNVSYWQPCPECFLPANYHRLFPTISFLSAVARSSLSLQTTINRSVLFRPFSALFPTDFRRFPEPLPNHLPTNRSQPPCNLLWIAVNLPADSQQIAVNLPAIVLVQVVTVVFEPALIASPVLVHLNEQL